MASEVDVYEIMYRIARERNWSPDEINRFEYILSHLERNRILRDLVRRWYGEQLRVFPERAWENTIRLLAKAFESIYRELAESGVDVETTDLAIAFETIVDYDRESIGRFVEDALKQVLAVTGYSLSRRAESVATELEHYITRALEELKPELSKLRELDPEAFSRVMKSILDLAGEHPRVRELREELERLRREREVMRKRYEKIIANLQHELETLRRKLNEAKLGISRAREEAKKLAKPAFLPEKKPEEKPRREEKPIRIERPALAIPKCPGGEEPITLDTIWDIIHGLEMMLDPWEYGGEFRRWAARNWKHFSDAFKRLVFYDLPSPPPETSPRAWIELYRRFLEVFREHFPELYETLRELPKPIDILKFYALCPQNWLIYRVSIKDARMTLGSAVPSTRIIREIQKHLEAITPTFAPIGAPTRAPWKPRVLVRKPPSPYEILRVVGENCPICGYRFNPVTDLTEWVESGNIYVAALICRKCRTVFRWYPLTNEVIMVLNTNPDEWPEEWRRNLEKLIQMGWKLEML